MRRAGEAMLRAVRQAGYIVLTLWGVVTLLFFLFNVLPGDPSRMLTGQRADQATLDNIRRDLGLDLPLGRQYALYVNDLLPLSLDRSGDAARYPAAAALASLGTWRLVAKAPYLRTSYQTRQPVGAMVAKAAPASLALATAAILITIAAGIPLGMACAARRGSRFDQLCLTLTSLGMSLPSFFAAILVGWLFAFALGDITGLNLTGGMYRYGIDSKHLAPENLVLPALTLGVRPLSVVVQLTRDSLLSEMRSDYYRAAMAKGLDARQALRRHALRNALNPVVTAISGWFASMLAGMVFVEYIFGWKGIGYMLVDSLNQYDFPVVMGCILLIAAVFIGANLLTDAAYRALDPRIRISKP